MELYRKTTPISGVDAFFTSIQGFARAYQAATFSYVAVLKDSAFHIAKARIQFDPLGTPLPDTQFVAGNLHAGRVSVTALGQTAREFMTSLANGKVDTPHGELLFDHPEQVNATLIPFHPEGIRDQRRFAVLVIEGDDQLGYFDPTKVDWDLRAASPPYHDLTELFRDFGLGDVIQRGAVFEALANQVALVDYQSPVRGTRATPTIRASQLLDKAGFTLGLRILTTTAAVERRFITADMLRWTPYEKASGVMQATVEIDVPESSVTFCYLSYHGVALHFGSINDPDTRLNSLRAVMETFDPSLEDTSKLLFGEVKKGRTGDSRELEAGVARVLWMLGYSVIHVGGSDRTSDAVDLVAASPSGHIVLVECTIGMLKTQAKVAALEARAVRVKRRLSSSGTFFGRVVPVIVTSLSKDEVATEFEQAESGGVKVFTRESLEEALNTTTMLPPHADRLFSEMEEYLAAIQSSPAIASVDLS